MQHASCQLANRNLLVISKQSKGPTKRSTRMVQWSDFYAKSTIVPSKGKHICDLKFRQQVHIVTCIKIDWHTFSVRSKMWPLSKNWHASIFQPLGCQHASTAGLHLILLKNQERRFFWFLCFFVFLCFFGFLAVSVGFLSLGLIKAF